MGWRALIHLAASNNYQSTGRRWLTRHCEGLLRRSNPGPRDAALDCFAALAMTAAELARLFQGVDLDRLKREDAHAGAASEQRTRHPVGTIMGAEAIW